MISLNSQSSVNNKINSSQSNVTFNSASNESDTSSLSESNVVSSSIASDNKTTSKVVNSSSDSIDETIKSSIQPVVSSSSSTPVEYAVTSSQSSKVSVSSSSSSKQLDNDSKASLSQNSTKSSSENSSNSIDWKKNIPAADKPLAETSDGTDEFFYPDKEGFVPLPAKKYELSLVYHLPNGQVVEKDVIINDNGNPYAYDSAEMQKIIEENAPKGYTPQKSYLNNGEHYNAVTQTVGRMYETDVKQNSSSTNSSSIPTDKFFPATGNPYDKRAPIAHRVSSSSSSSKPVVSSSSSSSKPVASSSSSSTKPVASSSSSSTKPVVSSSSSSSKPVASSSSSNSKPAASNSSSSTKPVVSSSSSSESQVEANISNSQVKANKYQTEGSLTENTLLGQNIDSIAGANKKQPCLQYQSQNQNVYCNGQQGKNVPANIQNIESSYRPVIGNQASDLAPINRQDQSKDVFSGSQGQTVPSTKGIQQSQNIEHNSKDNSSYGSQSGKSQGLPNTGIDNSGITLAATALALTGSLLLKKSKEK